MSIAELAEESIISHLATPGVLPAGVDVVPVPDKQSQMGQAGLDKPRITVAYQGADYDGPPNRGHLSAGQLVQRAVVDFEVMVEARSHRGPKGILTILEGIAKGLLGFKPTGHGPLSLAQERFISWDEGTWLWSAKLRAERLAVQPSTDPGAAVLTQIIVQEAPRP